MFTRVTTATPHRPRRVAIAGALVAVAAVTLGACSTDGAGTASVSSTTSAVSASDAHTAADVTFTREMIPHHRQAVTMAQLVPARSSDPRVTELAAQIAAGQQPEIDELSARLSAWNDTVPETGGDHHPGSSMSGMMSAEDMSALAGMRGVEFDRTWLSMMIEHHTGAVAMARTELADGTDRASRELAQKIISAQESEIARMRSILAG